MSLKERALKIKMLLMDVDGVLTDGTLYYADYGESLKPFSVYDGIGIKLLHRAGIVTGVVSGRRSYSLERRLKDLGVQEMFLGESNKEKVVTFIQRRRNLSSQEIAYIGDDIVDISLLRTVGFPATVPSAVEEVKKLCVYVTLREAGKGAIRELAELILRLKGIYEETVKEILK